MKTYLLRRIPEELWRDFKSLCAWQGRTIHETLLALIRAHIREAKEQENDEPIDEENGSQGA
jgi:hypothetical protein